MQDETISLRFDQGRQRAWLFDRKLVRAEHPDARTATTSTSAGPTATGASTRRCG